MILKKSFLSLKGKFGIFIINLFVISVLVSLHYYGGGPVEKLVLKGKSSYQDIYMYAHLELFAKKIHDSTIWPMIFNSWGHDIHITGVMKNLSSTSQSSATKEQCSYKFEGNGTIFVNKSVIVNFKDLSQSVESETGGRWRPSNCLAKQKVALLVPYRNRKTMLGTWLQHLHAFLQTQQLDYGIFVIEQDMSYEFNRATLLNIGVKFALEQDHYDCIIFHDIDQLPMSIGNLYTCPEDPVVVTHYATFVDCRIGYQPIAVHFGLVSSTTPRQFYAVNGYSNVYFGWGGEDDDISERLRTEGLKIYKKPGEYGRYTCLHHHPEPRSNDREKFRKSTKSRYKKEGFNTLKFDLISFSETPLFTWIYVAIDKVQIRKDYLFSEQVPSKNKNDLNYSKRKANIIRRYKNNVNKAPK